jgi:uncharacterized protein YukE
MMSQVHGNPEAMRQFAQALRRFTSQLDSEVKRIDAQSRAVGETWNDGEYQKFMNEWQQTLAAIKRFIREAPKYDQHVMRKANDLEKYLQGGA